jgi:hypothetical protein
MTLDKEIGQGDRMNEKITSNCYLSNVIVDIASNENASDQNFASTIFGNDESNVNMINQFICGYCWNHAKEQYGVDSPVPKITGINKIIMANYKVVYVRFADEFITSMGDTVFFIFAVRDNIIRYFIFSMDTLEAYSLVEMRLFDNNIETRIICENETMETLNQYLFKVLTDE